MLVWLNTSLKSTETRDELSTTLYLQSKLMSRCLSVPDSTSLPTSMPQEQAAKTKMVLVVMAKGVFSIMHSYFETFGKFLVPN